MSHVENLLCRFRPNAARRDCGLVAGLVLAAAQLLSAAAAAQQEVPGAAD